jgi:hypothetical protein
LFHLIKKPLFCEPCEPYIKYINYYNFFNEISANPRLRSDAGGLVGGGGLAGAPLEQLCARLSAEMGALKGRCVAVVGWGWCHSIAGIKAVRMVSNSTRGCGYWLRGSDFGRVGVFLIFFSVTSG